MIAATATGGGSGRTTSAAEERAGGIHRPNSSSISRSDVARTAPCPVIARHSPHPHQHHSLLGNVPQTTTAPSALLFEWPSEHRRAAVDNFQQVNNFEIHYKSRE